jgi:transcriptional regulator of acetoin/glycerol metabolism
MARGSSISPSDLPQSVRRNESTAQPSRQANSATASRAETLGDAERDYLISLLQKNSGNVSKSAAQAGLSRQGLHKLLKKHGVDAKDYRP